MCLTPERRRAVTELRPDWKDLDDKALDDALAADYLATDPAVRAAAGRAEAAEAEVTALSAALEARDAKILELSAAVEDGRKKVLELSAGSRTVDPEALRDRAANYRDRLALMVDRGQISKDVADRVTAAGLADEKPSVLMLSGAADLGGQRPADLIIGLLDGMKPVEVGRQSRRDGASVAPPYQPLALSASAAAAGGQAETRDDPGDEAAEWEARQLKARGLAPAGK